MLQKIIVLYILISFTFVVFIFDLYLYIILYFTLYFIYSLYVLFRVVLQNVMKLENQSHIVYLLEKLCQSHRLQRAIKERK